VRNFSLECDVNNYNKLLYLNKLPADCPKARVACSPPFVLVSPYFWLIITHTDTYHNHSLFINITATPKTYVNVIMMYYAKAEDVV